MKVFTVKSIQKKKKKELIRKALMQIKKKNFLKRLKIIH